MINIDKKFCKSCGVLTPMDQFGSTNRGKGKQSDCRECVKHRSAAWRLQNNERTREYDVARRAERPRSIYSFEDKIKLWARQSGICFCCAIAIDEGDIPLAQIDHATPLARGGVDEYRNLALAHSACNQQKHNKTLLEHWQYRFNSGKDAVKLDNAAIKAAIARARSKS